MTDSLQVDATVKPESSSHDVVTFHVFNNTTDPIHVQIVQPLPAAISPKDVGTGQSKYRESWQASEDQLAFEHEIDWGMSLRTKYAIRNVTPGQLVAMFDDTTVTAQDENRTVLEQFRGITLELPPEYSDATTNRETADADPKQTEQEERTAPQEHNGPSDRSETARSSGSESGTSSKSDLVSSSESDEGSPVSSSGSDEGTSSGSGESTRSESDSVTPSDSDEGPDDSEREFNAAGSGIARSEPASEETLTRGADQETESTETDDSPPRRGESHSREMEDIVTAEPSTQAPGDGPENGEATGPNSDEEPDASIVRKSSEPGGNEVTPDASDESTPKREESKLTERDSTGNLSDPGSIGDSSSPSSSPGETYSGLQNSGDDEPDDSTIDRPSEANPEAGAETGTSTDSDDTISVSKTFAVAGAKGGVGKTTTSINLGSEFHRAGLDVIVVELDLAMANLVDFLDFDIEVESDVTFHEVLAGDSPIDRAIYAVEDGPDVLPSGTSLDGYSNTDLGRLPAVLDELQDRYDVVIVDTPAGLSRETIRPLELADEILLVSTPRMSAVRNADNTIDVAGRVGTDVTGIVLTKSGTGASPGGQKIADFLDLDLLGHVPDDDAIPLSQDAGRPVVEFEPSSPAATAYGDIARELLPDESEFSGDVSEWESADRMAADSKVGSGASTTPETAGTDESSETHSPASEAADETNHSSTDQSLDDEETTGAPRNRADGDAPTVVDQDVESDATTDGREPTEMDGGTTNDTPPQVAGTPTVDASVSESESGAGSRSQDVDDSEDRLDRSSSNTRSDGSGRKPETRSLGRKLKSLFGL
ncbi:MAG: AAA family ATPase [Natronomonas sp.]